MQIIHLSFDHPDQINPNKTKAVKNLCASLKNGENIIFSLNRTSRIWHNFKAVKEPHGYSMRIFGLPFGILLHLWMFLGYIRIGRMISDEGLKPDLIHAHKLTFEGIIAYYLARKLGVPYILTVRGNTDMKVIRLRKFSRALYRQVLGRSSKILFLAPWTIRCLQKYYPSDLFGGKSQTVPNIVQLNQGRAVAGPEFERFATVFHLKSLKIKNIK
ncbi:MAG: glycosyltransferase, partial [Bacteroidota bacterium]